MELESKTSNSADALNVIVINIRRLMMCSPYHTLPVFQVASAPCILKRVKQCD